jgi:hypothetical protein
MSEIDDLRARVDALEQEAQILRDGVWYAMQFALKSHSAFGAQRDTEKSEADFEIVKETFDKIANMRSTSRKIGVKPHGY